MRDVRGAVILILPLFDSGTECLYSLSKRIPPRTAAETKEGFNLVAIPPFPSDLHAGGHNA
jgi:hypothetical protein